MDKKGHEIVEAAIVLPILILVILSMITLEIYVFNVLKTQVRVHEKLIASNGDEKALFQIDRYSESAEGSIGGLASMMKSRECSARSYDMDVANIIRIGKFFGD